MCIFWGLLVPLEAGGGIAALGCRAPSRTRWQGGTSPPQPLPPPHLLLLLHPSERSQEVKGGRGHGSIRGQNKIKGTTTKKAQTTHKYLHTNNTINNKYTYNNNNILKVQNEIITTQKPQNTKGQAHAQGLSMAIHHLLNETDD